MSRSFFSTRRLFIAAAFVAFVMMTGCKCGKDMGAGLVGGSHNQTDSVSTIVTERIVKIHDTVPFYIPVEVHSSVGVDSSRLETKFAISYAFIDSTGRLHHSLENIPQQIDIPVEGSAVVSDSSHYESHAKVDSVYVPKPYPVEVERKLTKWQEFRLDAFWWLAVGLLGFILWHTRKLWLPLVKKLVK